MTDEEHTRCPSCKRLLGHESDCPTLDAHPRASGPDIDEMQREQDAEFGLLQQQFNSIERQLCTTEQQRDFLLGQVGALILRLAGEKVAAGLLDLPAASVYADRERSVINAGLAQLAERNKAD